MNEATEKTRLKLINKVVDVSFIYVSFIINKHAQTSTDDKKRIRYEIEAYLGIC